jgi:hypothetical protein
MTRTLPDQRTLPALLAQRARRASDARLALNVAGGVLATAAALWLRPPGWALLVAAATCFAAFGAWGIADRAIGERPDDDDGSSLRALRAARGGAAVIGALAALALGLLVFTLALGTWIS